VTQIVPESQQFLVSLFTDLRKDLLADRAGEGGPDREKMARELAIFDALLAGLARGGALPEDEAVRRYVVELAEATDEENGYQQAALEHRALTELVAALPSAGPD
jgi:hypothetical protein